MKLRLYPVTLAEANALVKRDHRHHVPAVGHRWSGGVMCDGVLVGAYIAGRPVARMTPQFTIAEVTRLVTDGTKNACSMLYSAAARVTKAKRYGEREAVMVSAWTLDDGPSEPLIGNLFPEPKEDDF